MKANLKCRLAVYDHYFILKLISESTKEKEVIEDFERKLKEEKIERISTGGSFCRNKKEHVFLLKCK